ncbi:MAG: bifunctional diaminohydroxyphosphoribosylaminopyrimidine deaminase/5-amino-6-(5-phosphoribosylamino)uracil reductase RibD [Aquificaceae bacterium]|nr:bifunctional diaminohydroxyphosphoribosylaminopyrimidine deaminase/5-amino-6-(5-phosphoribosylamino)uracil reductase RibD [Aquificaceae bacterium]
MQRALRLARARKGLTHPNPTVGCVIVKDGKIISEANHERAGALHAEARALELAGERARGATVYVTLEPCNHFGKTPPCTEALIKAGVKRVVIATLDVNPIVCGAGVQRLKQAGIEVEVGICEEEAKELNEDFFTYIRENRPYITLKWAQSIDGSLATKSGESKWISSEKARAFTNALRAEASAVLVGSGTVIKDDPRLTVREVYVPKQPLRVVIDRSGRLTGSESIFSQEGEVLVFREGGKNISARSAEVYDMKNLSLGEVLKELRRRQIVHLLVEGGPKTIGWFLKEGFFDRVFVVISPKIIGEGLKIEGFITKELSQAIRLKTRRVHTLGEDIALELVKIPSHEL